MREDAEKFRNELKVLVPPITSIQMPSTSKKNSGGTSVGMEKFTDMFR